MNKKTIEERIERLEYNDKVDTDIAKILFFLIFILFSVGFVTYFIIQSQIDSLPKKVCHNETETKEINATYMGKYLLDKGYNLEIKNYICEDNLHFENDSYYAYAYYKCLVKTQKEVCEIK